MSGGVFKPGDHCSKYQVVRLLGTGGFAEVYEVVDPSGARRALKTLATTAEARPKLRARLAQEGAALAMIDHPNVVRLFDSGFLDDRIYLVLELVHGKTLREILAENGNRLPPLRIARWIQKACEGVAEAHRVGVVHRDLKPENILVTPDDVVKVIDFGIAKLSKFGVKTTNEQAIGTALYMSPEHIQGKAPDPRMDVYALGLVLHEAIAGAHPIVTEPGTVFQICAAQLNNHPPPLARVAPWAPPELAAAVDRAVEKDPNRRPPSITALANALADCIERSSGPPSAAAPASAGGFSASAPTPVIATGSLRALRGPGGTQVMAATTASIPSPTAEGAVIAPGAPLSTSAVFGPTAPVPGAITEPAPADPTTMPVVVKPPATAAAPAPAAPRSRAKVVAVVATAALLGLGGGTWGVIELVGALRARSVPPASPSAKPSAAPPKGKAR